MSNSNENIENLKHFYWVLAIYVVYFGLNAIAEVFFYQYKYLVTTITFILSIVAILLTIFVIRRKKRRLELDKINEEVSKAELEEVQKLRKWEFLCSLPYEEQKAIEKQFNSAQIWGFWSLPALDNEVLKYFLGANKVKIKVTRGYNLFFEEKEGDKEKDIFYRGIFEDGKDQRREIELLLHFPCSVSPHTRERAIANKITVEEYIETLFKVIKKLKEVTSSDGNKNEVTVRFYADYEIKWRYYIFESREREKVLFLNYYDEKKRGADSPMLKVKHSTASLCDDFDKKFDDIFHNLSVELVSNNRGDDSLIQANLCKHKQCENLIRNKYQVVFRPNS
jgi:hypothetical protein